MTSADYAAFSHPAIRGTSAASWPGCRAATRSTYLRSVTRASGACEDGDPCTVGDTCVEGICHPGPAMDCSHDPCTADSCDPVRGCTHVPLSGTPCDDGDACTAGDHCDAGACRGAPVACPSDGVACTLESCVDGACRSTPVDASCGGDQCAVGTCRPGDPAAAARGR